MNLQWSHKHLNLKTWGLVTMWVVIQVIFFLGSSFSNMTSGNQSKLYSVDRATGKLFLCTGLHHFIYHHWRVTAWQRRGEGMLTHSHSIRLRHEEDMLVTSLSVSNYWYQQTLNPTGQWHTCFIHQKLVCTWHSPWLMEEFSGVDPWGRTRVASEGSSCHLGVYTDFGSIRRVGMSWNSEDCLSSHF